MRTGPGTSIGSADRPAPGHVLTPLLTPHSVSQLDRGASLRQSATERDTAARVSDVLAFLFGAACWVAVQVLGRLYIGELFLLVCAVGLPVLFATLRGYPERRLLGLFLGLGGLYFVGLVATDLYRHTPFADYARGWARALIYLGNFSGLLVLGYRRPVRLV